MPSRASPIVNPLDAIFRYNETPHPTQSHRNSYIITWLLQLYLMVDALSVLLSLPYPIMRCDKLPKYRRASTRQVGRRGRHAATVLADTSRNRASTLLLLRKLYMNSLGVSAKPALADQWPPSIDVDYSTALEDTRPFLTSARWHQVLPQTLSCVLLRYAKMRPYCHVHQRTRD